MVVDDSVVVRRFISEVIASDPELEVVATAASGKLALQRLNQVEVDLVTLDVEMPELDGFAALAELRKRRPDLPVLMFSSASSRAAASTIEALTMGANDYLLKPEGVAGLEAARERLKSQLIPKIKALCPPARTSTIPILLDIPATITAPVTAVAIAVSTGGPPALHAILAAMPAELPVPIFIVQHMPPTFTSLLAARLQQATPLKVVEAMAPAPVQPGHVYLAPGDFHLVVDRSYGGLMLRTNQDPPEGSCRPAADVLFRSLATAYGSGCLGVVLTGMGADGARGCEAIKQHGGSVIVQDRASSVVWGMPGAVVRARLADAIVPLTQIAFEITRRIRGATRARVA
ncbi:MAG: chemotaxis-specific protein-glutamate methyltransferase CheB [Kofleriaceae bacterium]